MKTKLIIDEDLKGYLLRVHDRSNNTSNVENCKRFEVDNFNCQWIFKFKNDYGASVIKHDRKLWI